MFHAPLVGFPEVHGKSQMDQQEEENRPGDRRGGSKTTVFTMDCHWHWRIFHWHPCDASKIF